MMRCLQLILLFLPLSLLPVPSGAQAPIWQAPPPSPGLPDNWRLLAHAHESLARGIDYRWGGNDPHSGLDGGAYVGYLYQRALGAQLPRTATGIAKIGRKVPRAQMQPGDLVLFHDRRHPRRITHVGVYIGHQEFIHASQKYGIVKRASLTARYWKPRFHGARRVTADAVDATITPP